MRARTKRRIGWSLFIGLILAMVLGLPIIAASLGYIDGPWYYISLQAIGALGGFVVLVGLGYGIGRLIASED